MHLKSSHCRLLCRVAALVLFAAVSGPVFAGNWVKQATLSAADGEPVDLFGQTMAFSDDSVLVGAPSARVGDNAGQGAVYVFGHAAGGIWSQQARLTTGDGDAGDAFGTSVAISGPTAVIGAQTANVGGNNNQGAAYIFTYDGTAWHEQARLVADDGAPFNQFGSAVAVDGDTVLVGAILRGAVYVFVRDGADWVQQARLAAPGGAAGDFFGSAVALAGDTAVIGARQADVDGNTNQGAAYVFTRSGGTWSEQATLTAGDGAGGDAFGYAVALLDDLAVVGAARAGVGGNGEQGAAYVFARDAGAWSEQEKLTASDGTAGDFFGTAAAITDGGLLLGANFADIDGNENQGAAYLFVHDGGVWSEQTKLTATAGAGGFLGDHAGSAVALADGIAVLGAPGADESRGAAYVFVDIPDNVGTLSGTVRGLGYCGDDVAALAGATVDIAGAHNTYTVHTDADGRYELFLAEDENPLIVTVTAPVHLAGQAQPVVIVGGDLVQRDFDLQRDAPCLRVQPDAIALVLDPGQDSSANLSLDNSSGAVDLVWDIAVAHMPAGGAIDCDNAPGLLIHDDGSIEQGYSGNPTTTGRVAFVDYFVPDDYPASFHAVCLAWTTFGPTSLDFEVVVFADDGPGGGPGTELGALAASAAGIPPDPVSTPLWVGVDIAALGVSIDQGGIFIGARWAPSSPNVFLAADESGGNPVGFAGGFRWSDDTDTWTPIQNAFFEYRSLFVRALAADPGCDDPGEVPWLEVIPAAGSTPAGATGQVQVQADAAGLHPGHYRANLCVHSNDPVSPLKVVPVALEVTIPPGYATLEGTVQGLGYCAGEPGAVPGVEVVIESQAGSFTVVPDAAGFYHTGLAPDAGPVTLSASAPGHLDHTITDVEPVAGETVVRDFGLTQEQPCLRTQPQQFALTLPEGADETLALALDNAVGGATLDWTIATAQPGHMAQGVDCHSAPGIMVHDDGTVENGYSEHPGPAAFVDRFTPPAYPISLQAVCLAFISPGPGQPALDFEIVVFADDGPGGGPGTELGVLAVSADDIPVIDPPLPPGLEPVWLGYDISALDISMDAGSVFIGARWTPANPPVYIAVDESPGNPVGFAGGYRWDSVAGAWSATEADPVFGFPNYRSLFVRAVMNDTGCQDPGEVSWISLAPAAGSVAAGAAGGVQVTVDTAGLAPGEYAASLCVASNDPRRPLLAVPLALTVSAPAPLIAVTPASLAVTVTQGQSETRPLTIANLGDAPLAWEVLEDTGLVFERVSAGGGHTCAVTSAGALYCWGSNGNGQLGVGDDQDRDLPVLVDTAAFDGPVVGIATGSAHTCAVTEAGSAYCWGLNSNGQLGVDDTFERLTPAVVVPGDMGEVIEIATGWQHTCAIDAAGGAYCWGSNFFGQLGNGDPPIERHVPWPVNQQDTGTIIHIAAQGGHTCAVNDQHTGFCWGYNDGGNLGDGSTEQRRNPVPIHGAELAAVAGLSLSPFHSCAVDTAGTAYCWGGNSFGQLGDGTIEDRHVPVPVVTDDLVAAAAISAGEAHTCALSAAGAAFCWGLNGDGQLGDDGHASSTVPVPVAGPAMQAAGIIDAGGAHTCAITDTGTIYCWGSNNLGQLGDGSTTSRPLPAPVAGGTGGDCVLPDWLGVTPAAGTLPGGDDQQITLSLDAGTLQLGQFTANLCLSSNDPQRPLVVVPVDLTVTPDEEPDDPVFSDRFEARR